MIYESPNQKDIIKELNRENAYRFWKPFIVPFGLILFSFPLVWAITLFADLIDYLFMNYTVQMGFFLVVVSLVFIVRREIKRW